MNRAGPPGAAVDLTSSRKPTAHVDLAAHKEGRRRRQSHGAEEGQYDVDLAVRRRGGTDVDFAALERVGARGTIRRQSRSAEEGGA